MKATKEGTKGDSPEGLLKKIITAFKKGSTDLSSVKNAYKDHPAITLLLEDLSTSLHKNFYPQKKVEKFINKANNIILNYAQHRYSCLLSFTDDEIFDTLVTSLNFLGEELNYSTVTTHYLDDVFSSIGDMLMVVDKYGFILYANQTACNLLEHEEENLKNKNIELFLKHPRYIEALLVADRTPQNFSFITAKGLELQTSVKVSDFSRTDNPMMGFVIIARDMSMLIKHQEEIEKKNDEISKSNKALKKALAKAEESSRLKSAFLANMSHEIRTPMNGIMGFAQLLKEPALNQEKQNEFINLILKSGDRMLNIINDLINISKVEAQQMEISLEEVNINEQLVYLFDFFTPEAHTKNIKLTFSEALPDSKAVAVTDKEKLIAILTNLLKNALKFTDEGSIDYGYIMKGEKIEFYVTDTGKGIPKDKQSLIFERFVQADSGISRAYEGAGLGLALSKAFVEMLNGEIYLKSNIDEGSTFFFTIPYNTIPKINTKKQNINISQSNNNRVINVKFNFLLVEDDRASQTFMAYLLKKYSDKLYTANSGKEALSISQSNPDIDIVFMDIKMPEIDGYTAAKKIKALNPQTYIIAQTAFALDDEKEKYKHIFDNYLTKPVAPEQIHNALLKYISQ